MPSSHLDPLPDEVLSAVCRAVGLQALLSSFPASSRLHRVWQQTIENLAVEETELRRADLRIISKYVNLRELKLVDLTGALRAWNVIGSCAPLLPRLTSLIINEAGAYNVLKTIQGSESFGNKLRCLCLDDYSYTVTADDLCGLAPLTRLEQFVLKAKAVDISDNDDLQDILQCLTSLKALEIDTEDELTNSAASLFPGRLTHLTRLCLYSGSFTELDEQVVMAAIPSLTGLQSLSCNYTLASPARQREALAALQRLTYLRLLYGNGNRYVVYHELEELGGLRVPMHTVDAAAFRHPSLQILEVGRLEPGDALVPSGVAQDLSRIMHLTVNEEQELHPEDADFRTMPTLPHLCTFKCFAVSPSNGRYEHLAKLLRNHSSTLEVVELDLQAPFNEALPRKLPQCKDFGLGLAPVNRFLLQLLAMCEFPSLEVLQLVNVEFDDGDVLLVDADLGWVLQLPKLRKLRLGGRALSEQVQAGVRQMLGGSEVELCFGWSGWE